MPVLLICLVLLVAAAKEPLKKAALVAGTEQNLSNLLFFRYLCVHGTNIDIHKDRVSTGPYHLPRQQEIVVTVTTANIMAPHVVPKQK